MIFALGTLVERVSDRLAMIDLFKREGYTYPPTHNFFVTSVSDEGCNIQVDHYDYWWDSSNFEQAGTPNKKTEVNKMEMKLEDMNKDNLKEAKKQFNEENKNNEIEEAKRQLRAAQDHVDTYNRQIENIKKDMKPHEETIATFKALK